MYGLAGQCLLHRARARFGPRACPAHLAVAPCPAHLFAYQLEYGVIPRLGWSGADDAVLCHQCERGYPHTRPDQTT